MFDIVAAPIPNAAGIKEPVMANSADPTDLRPGIVILWLIDGDGSKMQYCAKAGLDKAVEMFMSARTRREQGLLTDAMREREKYCK